MPTTFQIPKVLQPHADGRAELELQGATVGELLENLRREYPALHRCICNEQGVVRQHINLFVNNDFLRDRNGLDTRIVAGDVVSVFQAVSGG